jgi:nicotinate phosphoribosyltransferase
VATAIEVAGPGLGGVRIDSGDLGMLARQVRVQLDSLGAHRTRIVVSGDLDEYAIAALRAEPVDAYGVGTRLVTGSGAPTAGMVYKLVEVDGIPVAKRSAHKESLPGAKRAVRLHRSSGTAVEEVLLPWAGSLPADPGLEQRDLMVPLMRDGDTAADLPTLAESRALHESAMVTLPWEGLALSEGEPAVPVRVVPPGPRR